MTVPVVHRTQIDGVPAFWVDSSRPTLEASLYFRCGLVDQTFPTAGWFHLVEHLVLRGTHGRDRDINGSVDVTVTSFDVSGDPDVVAAHLAAITSRMRTVAQTDLDHELKVLTREIAERGGDPWLAPALRLRYGPHGPGLADDHYALWSATAESAGALMRRALVRQNAALCLSGPPPAGLRLDLGDGAAWPMPTLPTPLDTYPCSRVGVPVVATLSGSVRRSAAARAMSDLLIADVMDDLRHGDGTSYTPQGGYVALSAHDALVFVGAEADEETAPRIGNACLAAAEALASRGPTAADVEANVRATVRQLTDPLAAAAHAWNAARECVEGSSYDPGRYLEEVRTITTDQVQHAARELVVTTLLALPDTPEPGDFPVPHRSDPDTESVPADHVATMKAADGSGDEMRHGPSGFTLVSGGLTRVYPYTDVIGVVCWPDGRREVYRRDGSFARYRPSWWREPQAFEAALDAAVPRGLVVTGNPAEEWPEPGRGGGYADLLLAIAVIVLTVVGVLFWVGAGGVRFARLFNPDAFAGWPVVQLLVFGVVALAGAWGLGALRERLYPDTEES